MNDTAIRFQQGKLQGWPWNNAAARKDMGCASDCNTLWVSDDLALLFHVTSVERAQAILTDGPKTSVCRIGFDQREQADAFWANCVPFVPYSVEMWMPHIDSAGKDVDVLAVTVRRDALKKRYHFEPSWPFAQFALQPEDIVCIERVAPSEFLRYRSKTDAKKLAGYWADENKGTSAYFDKVFIK